MANHKIDHKNITLTQKRKAIKDVKHLVAKGNTVSRARLLVGRTLGVTANTVYNWERKFTGKTTRTKGLNAVNSVPTKTAIITRLSNNGTDKPRITSINLHIPGKGNITLDHNMLNKIAQLAGHVS